MSLRTAPEPPATVSARRPEPAAAVWYAGLVTALALVVAGWVLSDESQVGSLGLIEALSPLVLIGGAVLAVLAVLRLHLARRLGWIDGGLLVAGIVVLHGTPAVVESAARFPVAWLHAGFVDHIATTGTLLPYLDARFSWPGFFTMAAAVTSATGVDPLLVLRFTPLVAELLLVALAVQLVRALGAPTRTALVAGWLYATFDWLNQTYYAPQTFAVIVVLGVLLVMVHTLPRGPLGARWARWITPLPGSTTTPQRAWAGLMVVTLLAAALAGSHQLTPVLLILQVLLLVVIGRVRPAMVFWLVTLLAAGWVTYMAKAYWLGHFAEIVGDLGNITGVVQSSVGDRVGAGSAGRAIVLNVRMALTAVLAALAAWGVLRRWREHRRIDLAIVALAAAPVVLFAMQSYGGEIAMRVVLYALPFAVLVAAWAVIPAGTLSRLGAVALAVILVGALPLAMIAHYGNESYERVAATDVQGVDAMYEMAPAGSTLVVLQYNAPWQFEHFTDYQYTVADLSDFELTQRSLADLLPWDDDGTFLFVTDAQIAQLEQVRGLSEDYGVQLRELLASSPLLEEVYSNETAVIYRLDEGSRS